jgi:hypothetical protein
LGHGFHTDFRSVLLFAGFATACESGIRYHIGLPRRFFIEWYDAICLFKLEWGAFLITFGLSSRLHIQWWNYIRIWHCFNHLWSERDAFYPKMILNWKAVEESLFCIRSSCIFYSRAFHLLRMSNLGCGISWKVFWETFECAEILSDWTACCVSTLLGLRQAARKSSLLWCMSLVMYSRHVHGWVKMTCLAELKQTRVCRSTALWTWRNSFWTSRFWWLLSRETCGNSRLGSYIFGIVWEPEIAFPLWLYSSRGVSQCSLRANLSIDFVQVLLALWLCMGQMYFEHVWTLFPGWSFGRCF